MSYERGWKQISLGDLFSILKTSHKCLLSYDMTAKKPSDNPHIGKIKMLIEYY